MTDEPTMDKATPGEPVSPVDETGSEAQGDQLREGAEASSAPSAEASAEGAGGADTADPEDYSEVDVAALLAEREQFLEAYRRTAADFENYRKQSQRRLADEVSRTQGAFVERLLPVLDAVDAARAQGSQHVEAVANALYLFLEREGLERVAPENEPFDPNVADAVMHEPGEGEPVVSEVLRTGYLWKGRVIRPAMVKVSG